MPIQQDEHYQVRLEKLHRLQASGIDPYPAHFHRTHTAREAVNLFEVEEKRSGAEARTSDISVAGRIVAARRMGKATFLVLQDGSGRIQTFFKRDILGEKYELLKELDLGDFVGATGAVFRTRAGEITVEAREFQLLSKALRPLPEKWHGLADVEKRFRQRYLDLISNEQVLTTFHQRGKIIDSIRRFLNGRGFVEVETPVLVPVAAGAMARPFTTHHNALDRDLYLRIALELYLKRLIIGGMDKVYEIGRVFRNEGIDMDHNPEFTMLESYEAYADYNDVMDMVEQMVYTAAKEVLGKAQVDARGQTLDFTPPWPRVSLREEVLKHTSIDFLEYPDLDSLSAKMTSLGLEVERHVSWGKLLDKLISMSVEPHLIQPTFLIDYPVEMSPLAKRKTDNPGLVERFEAFALGMEIANAFTELNDPLDQRKRMEDQEAIHAKFVEQDVDRLDEDFLLALEHGMPPTGGLGIGIDRLMMILTGQSSIREVILFPQLRTK